MTENFLHEIHKIESFNTAILNSVVLDSEKKQVITTLTTDKVISDKDRISVDNIVRAYVPSVFESVVDIKKLSPDAEMVKTKIFEAIDNNFKALSVTLDKDDVKVVKKNDCFEYSIALASSLSATDVCDTVSNYLGKLYCGKFIGRCTVCDKRLNDIEVDEEAPDNIEFEVPIRKFEIENFSFLEGTEKQSIAVYLSDLNFESEKAVICGTIEDIRERTYTNSKNQEKTYYVFTINDTTAKFRVTYFTRLRSIEKIKALKVGDSIVCAGKSELFNGYMRYTANTIDYGSIPKGFVPEKRISKPVPVSYLHVSPKAFSDIMQSDMFTDNSIPSCLGEQSFVVFDLETTGLNSSPAMGAMDRIIEIGAYKVEKGVIKESFTTFVNPQRKISEEITNLTGITDEMVADAPTYEQVMPDFFKFCSGSVLVGHNIAGFDFKFVDYYCSRLGYILERKIIDTLQLAQELLFLSNYKLNTIADKFGITFNHHRAIDDAYVTAKIFIELIKIKKFLPKLQ